MKSASLLSAFAASALFFSRSHAVTLTDASQLTTTTYDYIIVGGMCLISLFSTHSSTDIKTAGNAGLVLANRLTENASTTVLVLEAGVRYAQMNFTFTVIVFIFTALTAMKMLYLSWHPSSDRL